MPDDIKHLSLMDRDQAVKTYMACTCNLWASKDFIGAIWGIDWYLKFYYSLLLEHETLEEPVLSALVTKYLHDYNIEVPEIVKWSFRGIALGVDLERFYHQINDEWHFLVKDPPTEVLACVKMFDIY